MLNQNSFQASCGGTNTLEAGAGGPRGQSQPGLLGEFKASMGHVVRPYFKTKTTEKSPGQSLPGCNQLTWPSLKHPVNSSAEM